MTRADLGVVVIGRNEGERLERCLRSLLGRAGAIVYVDSGSSDGSVAFARSLGIDVVDLDLSEPFTMPRGRNEGFRRLSEVAPDVRYVQFVDGDCEVMPGWLERACGELDARPDVAVVCGRRRERHPEASRYNRMCDIEWDGPLGDVSACGGDAMMRASVFRDAGGFVARMIAGEEAELCLRIRRAGWKVVRLDVPMTLHDAAITRFRQAWRRWVRGGHAYAEGWAIHRGGPERHNARPVASAVLWGAVLPATVVAAVAASWWRRELLGLGLALLGAYAVLLWRAYRRCRRRIDSRRDAAWYAASCLLAKPAQVVGIATYFANRARRRRTGLIEYKEPVPRA
jgi:GT2 family glycosyltransferase